MIKIELDTKELMILRVSLYTTKFLHYRLNSWQVAFDRNAGELLLKIYEQIEINLETGQKRPKSNYLSLEKNNYDYENILETAKKHLLDIDEWIEYSKEKKEALVKNLLYPLHYQKEIFEDLIEYTNLYFSNPPSN
jgi:hypothetical protein